MVISYKYYLRKIKCPACETRRLSIHSTNEEKIYLTKKDNLVYVNCRRCGKYVLTTGCFKYLDEFEKKSRLHVYLAKRPDKNIETEIFPKFFKEVIL